MVISMNKSIFIINDEILIIKSIIYKDGNLSVKTTNNYKLNIDFSFDITGLSNGARENISNRIYEDQCFITEKYSYLINIGNDVYLTRNDKMYLLEIILPKVKIHIPPFDIINKKRLELNKQYDELEIYKLEVKIYFSY